MSEDEEEDWFERALDEDAPEDDPEDWDDWAGGSDAPGGPDAAETGTLKADTAGASSTGDAAGGVGSGPEDADSDPGEADAGPGADPDHGTSEGPGDETSEGPGGDTSEGPGDDTSEGPGGDTSEGPGGEIAGAGATDDDDPGGGMFEDDFAAAMGGAPDVDVDDGGSMSGAPGDVGGGPGSGGGMGDFGMGGDAGGEFDMGGGMDDFGMGGGAGGGFDEDEDVDSDLDRIDLGIQGLDEMIQGGIPDRSLMVTIGSAGTGKTTFALQFLHEALEQGERGIYITLEESRQRVISSATEKGLEFDEYVEDGQLAVVDLDPVEMANSLRSIRSELPRLIKAYDATRLVLDSVSLLEMMYEDRAKRRNEIYDFTRSLKNAGVTTMLTSEADDSNPYTSRHGIVEYLTDAVFVLQYVRPDDFRETRLAIEIQKIRDANHSRETKPYEITNDGISVYRQANIF